MGRKAMMYFISVVIIIVTTLMFVLFASGETDTNNIVFLKGYGWEVRTKSVEKEDIIIPKPFDRVYENYNDIQLKAGLDLRPYMGMKGVRYTYIVENYPKDVGEEVIDPRDVVPEHALALRSFPVFCNAVHVL